MNLEETNIISPSLRYKSGNDDIVTYINCQGISKARNIGAKETDKKYLLFIDDDITVNMKGLLYILAHLYNNHIFSIKSGILTTRILGLSRKVFEDINGFDNSFSSGEDYELGLRLLEKGYTINYMPKRYFGHVKHKSRRNKTLEACKYNIRLLLRYKKPIIFQGNETVIGKLNLKNIIKTFLESKRLSKIGFTLTLSILLFYRYIFNNKRIGYDVT